MRLPEEPSSLVSVPKTFRASILFIVAVSALAACTDQEAYYDAGLVRDEAIAFYTDEILKNLIRASNHEFFMHIDVSSLQPTVQTRLSATFGGGQTLNDTGTHMTSVGGTLAKGVVGLVTTASAMATRPLTFSLNPERDNGIQLTLQPVFGNQDNVYGYYIQYLHFHDTKAQFKISTPVDISELDFGRIDSLQSTDDVRHLDSVSYVPGTLRYWKGKWYYIPMPYKQKYFELCMLLMQRPEAPGKTTLQREISKTVKKAIIPQNLHPFF